MCVCMCVHGWAFRHRIQVARAYLARLSNGNVFSS